MKNLKLKEATYFDDFYIALRPLVDKVIMQADATIAGYEVGTIVAHMKDYIENVYSIEEAGQFREALRLVLMGII